MKPVAGLLFLIAVVSLAACSSTPSRDGQGPHRRSFEFKRLGKTDIDTIVEIHHQRVMEHLRSLMIKLYRRNPVQLRRAGNASIQQRLNAVFGPEGPAQLPELDGCKAIACIHLALNPAYAGDRVMALIMGLATMCHAAYGNKTEFYLFDRLDPQKLYNSARNIEIAVWKLSNTRDGEGRLLLLSNSRPGETRNLSYERLLGKIISLQDTLAIILADGSNRVIKKVIQNMATAVFLPI